MNKLKNFMNKALDFLKIDKEKAKDVLVRTLKTGVVAFIVSLGLTISQKGFTAFDATLVTALTSAGTAIWNYLLQVFKKEVPDI